MFYEQFLTKDYDIKRKKVESSKLALLILALLNTIFISMVVGVITFGFYIFLSLIARYKFIEFEYELTGNELVISKISNKKSRRIVANIKIDEVIKVKTKDSFNNEGIRIVNLCLDEMDNLCEKVLVVREGSSLIGYKVALDKDLARMCGIINPSVFKEQVDTLNK